MMTPKAPRVVMVNETLARRFWANQNPIGKKVWAGRQAPAEVVGVLGDEKNISLAADPNPEVFLPFPQLPWAHLNLSLRTASDPAVLVRPVRAAIAQIDSDQPVTRVQTLDDVLAASASQRRFTMLLLGAFSGTAMLLALIGIYGLVAYSITQRSAELGIRIALGATRGDILKLVLGQGAKLALSGVAIGAAGSLLLSRLLSGMLYRTSATDPLIFLLSAILFTAAALGGQLSSRAARHQNRSGRRLCAESPSTQAALVFATTSSNDCQAAQRGTNGKRADPNIAAERATSPA